MKLQTVVATLALGALCLAGEPASSQTTPPAKKAPARRPTVTPVSTRTAGAVKKPVASTAVKHTTTAKKAPIVRTTWRTRQTAPTSDRYREIQQALVARGYLSAEDANGAWGAASADALKKFQAEQSLETTGKLDSLSLIALGLGPRHDSAPSRMADGNAQPELGHNN